MRVLEIKRQMAPDDVATVGELLAAAERADGHQALESAQELLPDVILMDINMGDWDGVTATRRVRNSVPSSRVIVLTNYDEDNLVFSSIRAGASGYLLKEVSGQSSLPGLHR